MRPLLLFALAVSLGCGGGSPTAEQKPALVADPPKAPRPTAKKVEPTPAPPANTFEQDWAEAKALLNERASDWYAPAKLAITKMEDPIQAEDAEQALRFVEAAPRDMAFNGTAAKLRRHGLGAVARVWSAKTAVGDKEFRDVAQRVWVPAFGAEGVAGLAEKWFQMSMTTRQGITSAVMRNTPPVAIRSDIRDAMIDLGLEHWLVR